MVFFSSSINLLLVVQNEAYASRTFISWLASSKETRWQTHKSFPFCSLTVPIKKVMRPEDQVYVLLLEKHFLYASNVVAIFSKSIVANGSLMNYYIQTDTGRTYTTFSTSMRGTGVWFHTRADEIRSILEFWCMVPEFKCQALSHKEMSLTNSRQRFCLNKLEYNYRQNWQGR